MDLYQLKYLRSVVESGSFSDAANKNHVTQSALSIAIKKLETELGLTLLDRKAKTIVLTPSGEAIYPFISKAISGMDDNYKEAAEYSSENIFSIRIGIPTVAQADDLIMELTKEYGKPDSKIRISFDQFAGPNGIELLLERRNLDIGLLMKPVKRSSSFDYADYTSSRFCVIYPKNHHFNAYKHITPEMLSDEKLLVVDRENNMGITYLIMDYLIKHNVSSTAYSSIPKNLRVSDAVLLRMVEEGYGLAIMPRVHDLPEGLMQSPLFPALTLDIIIAWHKEASCSKAMKRIINHMTDYAARQSSCD